MPRTLVNNEGKGDCMYYAYSISLMYYLRAKASPDITESVFNNLGLNKEQRAQDKKALNDLLLQAKPFSESDLKKIQDILAPITRQINAEATQKEFKDDPKSSGLYAAASYGLIHFFQKELGSEYNFLNNNFNNPDFTNAEIFKLPRIKLAMIEFAKSNAKEIRATFNEKIPLILAAKQAKKLFCIIKIDINPLGMSTKDLETYLQHKTPPCSLNGSPAIITYEGKHYFADQEGDLNIKEISMVENFEIDSVKRGYLKELTKTVITSKDSFNFAMADASQLSLIQKITNRKTGKLSQFEIDYFKKDYLSDIIIDKTVAFFRENKDSWLNKYISHLKTRFTVWGTLDDANRLHAIVQGVRKDRDASGEVIWHFDQVITLGFQENSTAHYSLDDLEPDIILRNEENIHWTSLITDHQLNLSKQLPPHLSRTTASLSSTSIITDKLSTGKDRTFADKLQECEKLINLLRDTDRVFINEIESQLESADDDSLDVIYNLLKDMRTRIIVKPDSTDNNFLDRIIKMNNKKLFKFKIKYECNDDSEVYKKLITLVAKLNSAVEDYKLSKRDSLAKAALLKQYSSIIDTNIAEIRELPEIINEPWIMVAVKKLLEVFCDILSFFSPYFKGRAFTQSTQVDRFQSKIDDIKDKLKDKLEDKLEDELEDESEDEPEDALGDEHDSRPRK